MEFSVHESLLRAKRLALPARLTEATASLQALLARTLPAGGGIALKEFAKAFARPQDSGRTAEVATAPGGQFLTCRFSNAAGSRPYRLYVPASYHGQTVPLIVMLHGCTQSPEDFAAGTRMNDAAEAHGFLVAYPGQTHAANMQKCWNWFKPTDQQRDAGEPSLIAGITREVARNYAIDPGRIFIAGLSAGGAAASIMGHEYPDLYAAIGVHSGLACGAARDMASAFAAMKGHGTASPARGDATRQVPAIIFHGDRDNIVAPGNAQAVIAQSTGGATHGPRIETGQAAGGLSYSRALHVDSGGSILAEHWVIHGAGHAWSGGNADGSYTLPAGPDATAEMVRFFRDHPMPALSPGRW